MAVVVQHAGGGGGGGEAAPRRVRGGRVYVRTVQILSKWRNGSSVCSLYIAFVDDRRAHLPPRRLPNTG